MKIEIVGTKIGSVHIDDTGFTADIETQDLKVQASATFTEIADCYAKTCTYFDSGRFVDKDGRVYPRL